MNYNSIARYYDAIHAELTDDVEFVLSLAGDRPKSILELGCGTGRILIPLSRQGHNVTGIDNSIEMLALAYEKLSHEHAQVRSRVTLYEADMTAFDLGKRFDLALIPHNTLSELPRKKLGRALDSARKHLHGDAELMIDLLSPFSLMQMQNDDRAQVDRSFADPQSGATIIQSSSCRLDPVNQNLHITWIFEAGENSLERSEKLVTHSVFYLLYPHELELLLKASGLTLVSLYGGYDKQPYHEDSERILAIARPR